MDTQEQINHQVLVIILKKMLEVLSIKEPPVESVSIDNFDVVEASLRNELNKSLKPLIEQTKKLIEVSKNDKVEVTNFPKEKEFPSSFQVSNLSDLQKQFDELKQVIETLSITVESPTVNISPPQVIVEAPLVTVQPTPINIPQTVIPEVDLTPILRELQGGLNRLRTNSATRPLAVRLSDGQNFINQLQTLITEQKQAFAGFPGAIKILDIYGQGIDFSGMNNVGTGIGDGSKNVTTAGTRVQLSSSSITCKYVIIEAKSTNTGNIYIGGSTVSSTSGRSLVSLQSEKLDINDLNKVWIDSDVNGEGVTFVYIS